MRPRPFYGALNIICPCPPAFMIATRVNATFLYTCQENYLQSRFLSDVDSICIDGYVCKMGVLRVLSPDPVERARVDLTQATAHAITLSWMIYRSVYGDISSLSALFG